MLKPLGIAYIVSLFVSLIVAMTLTPLLCRLLLTGEKYLTRKSKENWLTRKMNHYYERTLLVVFRHKKVVLGSALALLIVSILLLTGMGRSFLPEFNEGALTITAVSEPGISLDESNQLGRLIEEKLLSVPEVISTARRTGRGELDEHSQATSSAEIEVRNNFV